MGSVSKFDIVGNLPPEIGILIFRQLEKESLWAASRVSRRWAELCSSDKMLQQKLAEWETLRPRNKKIRSLKELLSIQKKLLCLQRLMARLERSSESSGQF
ncbi:uncharacterized protein LOC126184556 [Schistocerca cancellata]|uniref:uncharacterized protein LOC126184556 n=1 Tax=Schistocerca cancellata TaxID=274614 RepID=UPI00211902DF|nr:uncharacterized protein LOC126184556 [Schistocerca cancellata]